MIVADIAYATVHLGPGTQRVRTRCLARRGMLHSECESVDHVRLSPGACYDLAGRTDTEAAWYVLRGPVALIDCCDHPQRTLHDGDLLLAPDGERVHLHGGPLGAELLCLAVLPAGVSGELPERRPDLPH
ncbi:hypothetical protein CFP65_6098 [Kitasatospora sp. MMS16-BH015]|uniref:hypothetical protein n=1 Tax=Kitasatospora sp. MMS16-BH015 TaxID=2018025 RepID=UPI000CA245E5|nr:hypothetical protein [Kitasatospora sp. MMS16-BH015]AUG80767.1 hypothetical protein CFP65_6098 [Kitasatospora sp. MMS16-BH015]